MKHLTKLSNKSSLQLYAEALIEAVKQLAGYPLLIFILAYLLLLVIAAQFGQLVITTLTTLLYVLPLLAMIGFFMQTRALSRDPGENLRKTSELDIVSPTVDIDEIREVVGFAKKYGGNSDGKKFYDYAKLEERFVDLRKTIDYFENYFSSSQLERLEKENGEQSERIKLLYLFTETLLGFLLQAGHWDELGKLMECVYRVSYSLHNWQAATQWSCELALLAYRRGYRKEMSAWIQKASKSAEHCKDELLKAKLIRLEALLFYVRCEYEEAELSLSRAYDMYKKLDETTGMITVLNDRGELEERLGNIENARGYYSKALQIAEESEEAYRHRGECYNNLGELILLKKNVDESDLYKAKDWFEKALSVAKKFDWRELEASVRWNLAQVYEKAMDYKHSYIYARHSLEIQKQLGIRESEMNKSLNFLLYFADRLTDYETVKFTV